MFTLRRREGARDKGCEVSRHVPPRRPLSRSAESSVEASPGVEVGVSHPGIQRARGFRTVWWPCRPRKAVPHVVPGIDIAKHTASSPCDFCSWKGCAHADLSTCFNAEPEQPFQERQRGMRQDATHTLLPSPALRRVGTATVRKKKPRFIANLVLHDEAGRIHARGKDIYISPSKICLPHQNFTPLPTSPPLLPASPSPRSHAWVKLRCLILLGAKCTHFLSRWRFPIPP